MEPEPIGPPRLLFRRLVRVPELLASADAGPRIKRFFADWDRSSAGESARFCERSILSIREYQDTSRPQLEQYYELPEHLPSYHDLHDDDDTFHPIDGMVLITAEAGEGFCERMARRNTQVHITTERDPHTAVALFLEGRLPEKVPSPPKESRCG